MCIVIDTNTFSSVFDESSSLHSEFRPVFEWIYRRKGKVVYGGTKYRNELRKATKFLRLFGEFKKVNKVVEIEHEAVDREQERLEAECQHPDFDDAHLIAIVILSGCLLICTSDRKAHPFIKNADFYPRHVKRPKIYSKKSNADLLCDRNIASCCLPSEVTKSLYHLFEAAR